MYKVIKAGLIVAGFSLMAPAMACDSDSAYEPITANMAPAQDAPVAAKKKVAKSKPKATSNIVTANVDAKSRRKAEPFDFE